MLTKFVFKDALVSPVGGHGRLYVIGGSPRAQFREQVENVESPRLLQMYNNLTGHGRGREHTRNDRTYARSSLKDKPPAPVYRNLPILTYEG